MLCTVRLPRMTGQAHFYSWPCPQGIRAASRRGIKLGPSGLSWLVYAWVWTGLPAKSLAQRHPATSLYLPSASSSSYSGASKQLKPSFLPVASSVILETFWFDYYLFFPKEEPTKNPSSHQRNVKSVTFYFVLAFPMLAVQTPADSSLWPQPCFVLFPPNATWYPVCHPSCCYSPLGW